MKKFKFSLETYKKVKEREEDEKKALLAEKRKVLSELEKELEDLIIHRDNEQKKFLKESQQGISPQKFLFFHNYFEKLKEQISIVKSKIRFLQNEIEEILNQLIEIKKQIKMLEILREKRYQEYLQEVNLEESKVIEEFISTTKYAKNAEAAYE
ncbi:MAG: flagellar export protein FliJ [Clostridiaceae bacterium]|nr:flagellar export protein FliJ [Clostridiaceae bacterium]